MSDLCEDDIPPDHPLWKRIAWLTSDLGEARDDISSLRAQLTEQAELLKNSAAVHLNMLGGTIALPSWPNIRHLYPEEFAKLDAQLASARKALDLAVNMIVEGEPGDSRAVSNEAVALAAVACGDTSAPVMAVIEAALTDEQSEPSGSHKQFSCLCGIGPEPCPGPDGKALCALKTEQHKQEK